MADCIIPDVSKRSPSPLLGKEVVTEQQKDHELKMTEDNSAHEEGEFFQKDGELLKNGHIKEIKTTNLLHHSYNSKKSRF